MFIQLLLATLVAAATATNSYVVLTPRSFRPGIPLSISVNILNSTTPVTVTAELISRSVGNQTVPTAAGSFSQGSPGILVLQVPANLHSGSYKLHIQGTGHGLHFQNQTDLTFERKSISIFIQTDKAMYKPGQTVHFRAFAVFPNLTVYTGPLDIDIYDPSKNKIKQWKGLQYPSGVITICMSMDTQPVLGDWKIKVSSYGRSAEKLFEVAHYVLPKFEVSVVLPSFAVTADDTLSGTVKAKYTYGKPVKGTVTLCAKLDHWDSKYYYYGDEPMVTQTFNINGKTKFNIPLAHIKQITGNLNSRYIVVEANVTEDLNKVTLSGNSTVKLYSQVMKLEFLKSNPYTFKPGLPYTAYLKVAQQDDTPFMGTRQDVNVSTSVTYELKGQDPTPYSRQGAPTRNYTLKNKVFTVPNSGSVAIQVDTPKNSTHINLNAHYGAVSANLSLSKSYSPSNNYMQLFLKSTKLQAGQIANFDIKATETFSSAVYLVLSRGTVVSTGKITGTSFPVMMTVKMAPNAMIVVYYVRTDGEIVTDSISFDVDGAFLNKVSVDFDTHKAQSPDTVHVLVTADPSSVVSLLVVDQSELLLRSGNDITASEVIDELKTYDTTKHPSNPSYGGSDAQHIFNKARVKAMTDATVYHHQEQNYCKLTLHFCNVSVFTC